MKTEFVPFTTEDFAGVLIRRYSKRRATLRALGPTRAGFAMNKPNKTSVSAPAILQGFVTASGASGGATADMSLAALQSVSLGSSPGTTRPLTIPLAVESGDVDEPLDQFDRIDRG
jgi:hypothetical protein